MAVAALLPACVTGRLARGAAGTLVGHAVAAQRDEPDLELARASAYSNLTLLEALRRSDPRNVELRLALAEGFAGAALFFAEEEALTAACRPGAEAARARVAALYERARHHATDALRRRHPDIVATLSLPPVRLASALAASTDRRDGRALLWLAIAWLGELTAKGAAPLADLGRARSLVERVLVLEPALLHGLPLVLLGAIDASVPAAASVSADRGAGAFARAIEGPGSGLMFARVERARTLHVALHDREAFRRDLEVVLAAESDVLPGERLLTAVARRRAERLLARETALFEANEGSIDAYYHLPCGHSLAAARQPR